MYLVQTMFMEGGTQYNENLGKQKDPRIYSQPIFDKDTKNT